MDIDEQVMMGFINSPTVSESPLDRIDLGMLSYEAFEDLNEKLLNLASEKNEPKQKIIQEELDKYLDNGWKYVDQNNGGKVIGEKK